MGFWFPIGIASAVAIALAVAAFIVIIILIAVFSNNLSNKGVRKTGRSSIFVTEKKRAGILGEKFVFRNVEELMQEGDVLVSNLEIYVHEKKTEIDLLVINKYGVRIIEVKNWNGELHGDEDDYNWEKVKVDDWDNVFYKELGNPIRQVKREIYLLKEYFKERDINVWVDGYVYFIYENSPVESDYVLESIEEIDEVIHSSNKKYLTQHMIDKIVSAVEDDIVL